MSLSRFLVVNGFGGFLVGLGVGFGYLEACPDTAMFIGQPLSIAMLLWTFGVSFGLGAIGTGLALMSYS